MTLLGNINNITGSTTIIAGGPITQPNPSSVVEGVQVSLQVTGTGGIGTKAQPINVVLAGTSGQSLTASTANGGIYIAAPQGALAINTITAGGDQAVGLTSQLGITGSSASNLITGGNVTIHAGGIVGTPTTNLRFDVGQASADQLTLNAAGDVYIEQVAGSNSAVPNNLQLFALDTTGQADITIDDGSLVNVNNNVHIDPRTVTQLEQGVWAELQLTGTAALQKVQDTLNEYQESQAQQYQAYWQDVDALEAAGLPTNPANPLTVIPLSSTDSAYYTQYFTTQGQQQGLSGGALNTFVANQIATVQTTNKYNNATHYAEYGPGWKIQSYGVDG